MDFTPVLRNAWRAARGHASWWLMAIAANSVVAGLSLPSFGGMPQPVRQRPGVPVVPSAGDIFARWWASVAPSLAAEGALLAALGAVALAILMLVWAWSIRAQGALSWGTVLLARGEIVRRHDAWRRGRKLFWRFAALSVLSVIVGLLALAIAVAAAYAALRPAGAGDLFRTYIAAGSSPLLALWTLVLVPLSIVFAFAKRAMAAEDLPLWAALQAGWRMLRRRLGTSLLAWAINLAFYLVGLLIVMVVVFVVGFCLTLLALILAAVVAHVLPHGTGSLSAGFVPYIGVAVGLAILAMLLCLGGLNVFLASFWSEVYVRLSLPRYDPQSIAIG